MADVDKYRQKGLELVNKLKAEARRLVAEEQEDKTVLAKKLSDMMIDMLALKRLNRNIFEHITVKNEELDKLKVRLSFICLYNVI